MGNFIRYDYLMFGLLPRRALTVRGRDKSIRGWKGDHPDDLWILYIPLPDGQKEMRSLTKVILFTRVTQDKHLYQWPVAAFADMSKAKTHAVLINTAHKTGNVDMAKSLDPQTRVDAEGKLVPGIKFSLVEVPYEPSLADSADDLFADEKPAAA